MANRNFKYSMVCILALLFAFAGTQAQTITFTKQNVTCFGGSNGSITATLSSNPSSYQYIYYKTFLPAIGGTYGPTTDISHTFTGLDSDFLHNICP